MLPFDSGKTTVARQIVRTLHDKGHAVEYFKPVSGHNYWYRFEHTEECLRRRMLLSYDVVRIEPLLNDTVHPFVRNPAHSLYVPARLDTYARPRFSTFGLAGWESHIVMERLSHSSSNGDIDSEMLIADSLIDSGTVIISREEAECLSTSTRRVHVSTIEALQRFESEHLDRYVSSCFELLERTAEVLVIESFSDSVWPWRGLDRIDRVFAVGPAHLFEYPSDKFVRAIELYDRPDAEIRNITYQSIAEVVHPIRRLILRPMNGLSEQEIAQLLVASG